MENLPMADPTETTILTTIVKGVKIAKSVSLKPTSDRDAPVKKFTLEIDFEGVTLGQVFNKASASDVITWQSNNRDKFDNLIDGSTITRKFTAPPVAVVTEAEGKQAFLNKLASLDTDEERQAYIEETLKDAK